MSSPDQIPQGLFGLNLDDIVGGVVDQVSNHLPKPISEAIKGTVDTILNSDDGPNIGDPQPEGDRPIPTTDPEELNAAVRGIDSVVAGIALVLKFGFIIPDDLEDILRKLSGALTTIRNWLD